ncbi:MAG: uroporphyrinogen-III synthase [Prevotellaceae bacterium]|jgi:uroporphyrinogen-III synthase|nr:uroporphyrinogen-III synthase [Prevotellaceae bacterium]
MKNRHILISQPNPNGVSSYTELCEKYGVLVDFFPFFHVESVTPKEFRAQKVTILDHTAIVFTARTAIDTFFKLCEEIRIVIPESMKYFCISESVAFYLQKYIVYRKRKIFYGKGDIASTLEMIVPKHKDERFLLALADNYKLEIPKSFEKAKLKSTKAILYRTVNSDLHKLDLTKYGMLVFYSPADIKSLLDNYPNFQQGDLLFATFGPSTAKALKSAKFKSAVEAPSPEAPSITKALILYFEKLDKETHK